VGYQRMCIGGLDGDFVVISSLGVDIWSCPFNAGRVGDRGLSGCGSSNKASDKYDIVHRQKLFVGWSK